MQVQPELPEFAAARDLVAQVRATTQAAAAAYLCSLTATQFERLANVALAAVAEDVRALLARVALAENLAEQAAAGQGDVAGLAVDTHLLAEQARDQIHALVSAEAAAAATDSDLEHDAPAAAEADADADAPPIVAEAATDVTDP